MAISRYSVREAGKQLAQDAGPGTGPLGVQLLLTNPGDYSLAVLQALRTYATDRPNLVVVDVTMLAAGFRIVLAGSGAQAELTGAAAWQDGDSALDTVIRNWSVASQALQPLDPNTYRVAREPASRIVLELLEESVAAGEVLRLAFTARHTLTESPNTVTVPAAAPGVALAAPAAAGNVDDGSHAYRFTWVTAQGETTPSAAASVTVVDRTTNGQVKVTVPPAAADQGVTAAKVYRQVAGSTGDFLLVGTLTATDGGGIFTDNVADASLGAAAPTVNTAGGANTVPEGHAEALSALTGSMILQMAANKAVQNTGNTGLPNDVVDRRNQSDVFSSRAKALREQYSILVGKASGEDLKGASAVKDLDVGASSGLGFLWHQRRNR